MKRNSVELKMRAFECPNCGSSQVETQMTRDRFAFGTGARAVMLEVLLPFRKCVDCEFQYTDSEAEDIRHETVCRHLSVMTPAEVVSLRKKYGLTRAEFAEKTRLGEASLARWETGELIQTLANDNYMHLLSFEENMERLERRHRAPSESRGFLVSLVERFKSFDEPTAIFKRREAAVFQL